MGGFSLSNSTRSEQRILQNLLHLSGGNEDGYDESQLDHFTREHLAGNYMIFTDGSVVEGKAGFALYDSVRRKNKTFSLPANSSNFSAESMAILKALEYVKKIDVKKIAIVTDSKSIVSHIEKINTNSDHVTVNILLVYRELVNSGKNITVCWIRGHSGIRENELVDVKAKQAIDTGEFCEYKYTKSDCRRLLNASWLSEWQEFHSGSAGGSLYRSRFPVVPKAPWFQGCRATRDFQTVLTRIRSNHGLWGAHKYKIGLRQSANCASCDCTEDMNHIIMKCPEYEDMRISLVASNPWLEWPDLFHCKL
ncbi:uncharacterized protein LOC112128430 [Cimex lectularius]|uniref:ribonuclease H n=1 Tax=Cimex lectularius TaxID=79782 RepID=A0A8I6SVH8_CIMLE|nr:uncharacterized protein LOC112128430 [Cimex lectularius]